MTSNLLRRHTFVSYSTKDKPFVDRLVADLANCGFEIWIDRDGLRPGTSDWDRSIRYAINESFSIVYLASPNSKDSSTVNGELLLAKSRNLPIYPVLMWGEWIDSTRLDMVNMQYIDLRNSKYENGLITLCEALTKTISASIPDIKLIEDMAPHNLGRQWDGHGVIQLPDENKYALIKGAYERSLDSLLDDLYLNFLESYIKPFTYGNEWLLITENKRGFIRVVQDWSWLLGLISSTHYSIYNSQWQKHTKLLDFGISADYSRYDYCRVSTNFKESHFIGLAFTSEDCPEHKFFLKKSYKFLRALSNDYYRAIGPNEINSSLYPIRYIIMDAFHNSNNSACSGEAYFFGREETIQYVEESRRETSSRMSTNSLKPDEAKHHSSVGNSPSLPNQVPNSTNDHYSRQPTEDSYINLSPKGNKLRAEMQTLINKLEQCLEEGTEQYVKNYIQRGGE